MTINYILTVLKSYVDRADIYRVFWHEIKIKSIDLSHDVIQLENGAQIICKNLPLEMVDKVFVCYRIYTIPELVF